MSRIHDMGGRFGDGEIPEKDMDGLFHADWEKHALALNLAMGAHGAWNIDASRHARECLIPRDYERFSYYEKWLAGLADLMVARGLLSREDLQNGPTGEQAPLAEKALRAEAVRPGMAKHVPYTRDTAPAPAFAVGDRVRTRSHSPNTAVKGGHTRLPSYARGRVGRVVMLHGAHVLPDSNAHFLGESPEPLYAVEFTAGELWGPDAENADDRMVLDMWQNYLEAAE